jgi:hypothetical protein
MLDDFWTQRDSGASEQRTPAVLHLSSAESTQQPNIPKQDQQNIPIKTATIISDYPVIIRIFNSSV